MGTNAVSRRENSLLGCRFPVMQASIGRVGDARLVIAVAEAGGLGSLGASYMPLRDLREQMQLLHRETDKPFAVNLILAFEQEERLEVALEESAPWISFSWGLDPGLVRRARASGARVLVQVTSVTAAKEAVASGVDGLIVQGVEAGGHVQGTQPLPPLIAQIRRHVSVPLVAAGGIAEPNTAGAALAAGADMISMGTRFAASDESLAHQHYRERLIDSTGADTILTNLFDIPWAAPHRVIRNGVYQAWELAGRPPPGHRPGEGEPVVIGPAGPITRYAMHPAVIGLEGDVGALPLYAGQGVGSISTSLPAGEIVERFMVGIDAAR